MAETIQRKDAKTQRPQSEEGSVLQLGMSYFWFDSHEKAAQAFALLSKATHVKQDYKPRPSYRFDHEYRPQELIGEISVKMVPRSALRLCDSASKPVSKP